MLHRIGDRVTHVDYPQIKGTIVGRYRNYELRQHIYEVLWSPRVQKKSSSRHIGSALKRISPKTCLLRRRS